MNILFINQTRTLLGLAERLALEGHTIQVFGHGNGLVDSVRHPYEAIKDCKFIVADGPVEHKVWEWARTFNKPVIGTNPLTEMINRDCYREWRVASKLNIPMPPTEVIDDISDMYTKVLEWNSARTLIRYDRETVSCDHQRWLAWAVHKLPLNKKILLQQPSWGEEIQVFGWFDGMHWARPFLVKTNSEGQLRASTVLALFERAWTKAAIQPWEIFLRNVEYKGPMSVRLLASRKGMQMMSVHIGFEFPSIYSFLEGLKEPIGDFLNRVAFGVCEEIDITTDYASCVIVGTALKDPGGVPIVGLDEGNRKHIFFGSVDKTENDILVADNPDWIYAISAHGQDLDVAFGRIKHTQGIVRVPEANIPSNIAPVHRQWFNKVKELGYL